MLLKRCPERWKTALLAAAAAGLLACSGASSGGAAAGGDGADRWVATWTTANMEPFAFPGAPRNQPPTAADKALSGFADQTVRMVARTSIGGSQVRVKLSNSHGSAPLRIGSAHVALRREGSAIVPESGRALTFSGRPSFTIPPGALVVSDPVDLPAPELTDLAVSVYLPGPASAPTMHMVGLHTTYIASGDMTGAAELAGAETTESWYFLSGIDVLVPPDMGAIVAFGDSITDGAVSTPNTDSSWPSVLAERLLAEESPAHLAVLNQGISGNRMLGDGLGDSALKRFDRDVLAQPGVKWVILLESINDIGLGYGRNPFTNAASGQPPALDDLTGAMRQLIERGRMHGLKVAGATLTPYEGAMYYSEEGEAIRQQFNDWVRTSGAFDAVIDFDQAVRDPENAKRVRPDYDPGDHLHPNDAGYRAMAESIDLSIFAK